MEAKMNRTEMRELAFKLMYEIEVQKDDSKEQLDLFIENNDITDKKVIDYLSTILTGIEENIEEIKHNIEDNLKKDWELSRISKVNISLLKIALYEMLYANLPYKVAINEVVELAKKYGDDGAPTFINGVLASVVKKNKLDA